MKKLILYFIVVVAAVWLGVLMHQHPGYVLLSVGNMQIETTLWFALIALLLAFFILLGLIRLLRGTFHLSRRYRDWSSAHSERKSWQLSQRGWCELLEGKWPKAEQNFAAAIKKNPPYLINYIAAAKAAQLQKAYPRRDEYLRNAKQIAQKSELTPLGIAQGHWQLEAGETESALATFTQLATYSPRNPVVLGELKEVYAHLGQWENLRDLLPKLERYHALEPAAFAAFEKEVFTALLQQASISHNAEAIEKTWDSLPKHLQKDPALMAVYTQHLLQLDRHEEAEDILKLQLRKSLNKQLLTNYAEVHSSNPARQLARAEEWLVSHPDNADLLYCLGQLCVQHRLWGKARNYLEKSLNLQPRAEAYQLLGQVLENLGDSPAALSCYRSALKIALPAS